MSATAKRSAAGGSARGRTRGAVARRTLGVFLAGGAVALIGLSALFATIMPLLVSSPLHARLDPAHRAAAHGRETVSRRIAVRPHRVEPVFRLIAKERGRKGARLAVASSRRTLSGEEMTAAFLAVARTVDRTVAPDRIVTAHHAFARDRVKPGPLAAFQVANLVADLTLPVVDETVGLEIAALEPESVPMPRIRPVVPRRVAAARKADNRTTDRSSDRNPLLVRRKTSPLVMAYGSATATDTDDDDGASFFGRFDPTDKRSWPGRGSRTAVYDISNGVVYMPNGDRLEAHSGIGHMRDNPRYAHVKMRGPTPPAVYRLRMRERRFHGVEAIRLLPVSGVNPLGRTGLLAHTYMLRRPGDSNGCLVFARYNSFLKAFKAGRIKRLIAVPKLPEKRTKVADLFS